MRAQDVERHGCDLHPDCLSCPLESCRHECGGLWQIRMNARRHAVAVAVGMGASRQQVCDQFGISRRTFFRDRGGTG
jgi:hypothetical protein